MDVPCSTTKAVFLECMIKRLMAFAATSLCSASSIAEGSSSKYTSAGVPRHTTRATRCISPEKHMSISEHNRMRLCGKVEVFRGVTEFTDLLRESRVVARESVRASEVSRHQSRTRDPQR